MNRRTLKILKLPQAIVRQVDDMLMGTGPNRKTYKEVSAWLAERGHPIGVHTIGRYQRWMAALARVRQVGEQAHVLVRELQSEGALGVEEATSKVAAVMIMEVLQEAMNGGRVDVGRVGRLIGDFARLQSSSVQRERFKADFRRAVEKARDKLIAGVRRAVKSDHKLCEKLVGLVEDHARELAR